ncbi:hypothetical protein AM629_09900 [Photorhabdus heterorhabditis]|uniref:Uncharacterized protein n=1 Tax=Photorhabdus heterorhabditis TaxID=880156 RepID=A0ABR5KCC3_9GAMM|nr:hypothetical protein AM629_09900 [Photorhabdus heterorhabditis]
MPIICKLIFYIYLSILLERDIQKQEERVDIYVSKKKNLIYISQWVFYPFVNNVEYQTEARMLMYFGNFYLEVPKIHIHNVTIYKLIAYTQ